MVRNRPLRSIKCRKKRIWLSGDIEQSKLHAPPFEQTGQHPAFIATEREVFGQDVSVALFKFPYQPAFGTISASEQRACAHIVRKNGQEQGILTEAAEKSVSAEQVGTQEGVCLPFRHIRREVLSPLQLMPITNIRIILPAVHTLKAFYYDYCTLKRWQVCQPHPVLGKGRLTEQAEYTK